MVHEIVDYATAAKYLKEIYDLINKDYFNNSLCDVTITIQKKAGNFGHFSLGKCWDTGYDHQHTLIDPLLTWLPHYCTNPVICMLF